MTEKMFFIIVTFVDLVAAGWIIAALFTPRLQTMPKWHRVGLLVGCIGLLAQALRNIHFLTTGVSATDADLPLWVLKDLGYGLIAFHSIWLVFSGRLTLTQEPATMSDPRRFDGPGTNAKPTTKRPAPPPAPPKPAQRKRAGPAK